MNAKELHALAPLGAYVAFSDGTPRPPDRFKIKLRLWERTNGAGYFVGADPGDPSKSYARPNFTLRTLTDPVLVVNLVMSIESALSFAVTPATPGLVLAMSQFAAERGQQEARHVWRDLHAAEQWSRKGGYKFGGQNYTYLMVQPDGTCHPFIPGEVI